ncbi:unnamed protein product [Pedinophyceae sp. YPF-701]|nr:unnamed protein product [Pedinophyceae sp. YPF-701]
MSPTTVLDRTPWLAAHGSDARVHAVTDPWPEHHILSGLQRAGAIGSAAALFDAGRGRYHVAVEVRGTVAGWPGVVHGGLSAKLCDEAAVELLRAMGRSATVAASARRSVVNYRAKVPTSSLVVVTAQLDSDGASDDGSYVVHARIHDGTDPDAAPPFVECTVTLTPAASAANSARALPERTSDRYEASTHAARAAAAPKHISTLAEESERDQGPDWLRTDATPWLRGVVDAEDSYAGTGSGFLVGALYRKADRTSPHHLFTAVARAGLSRETAVVYERARRRCHVAMPVLEGACGHGAGRVHTGVLSALSDETLGTLVFAMKLEGVIPAVPSFTARLEVEHVEEPEAPSLLVCSADLVSVEGRKIWVQCTVHDGAGGPDGGKVYARAKALFVQMNTRPDKILKAVVGAAWDNVARRGKHVLSTITAAQKRSDHVGLLGPSLVALGAIAISLRAGVFHALTAAAP